MLLTADPMARRRRRLAAASPGSDQPGRPLVICLLGEFGLLKAGRSATVRGDTKTATFLSALALRRTSGVPRDTLLEMLWPDTDPALAGRSLHSLVHSLRKLLGDAIEGAAPVLHTGGAYRLNLDAGLSVDVAMFDALVDAGDRAARVGDRAAAAESYHRAIGLYRGDLWFGAGTDIYVVIERERLRARYLALLAHLADYAYGQDEYTECLAKALRLLAIEPCREDAHRLAMRCYVRRGERAQALRQYRLCEQILHAEFNADPEPATTTLFERMRLDPSSI